MLMDEYDYDKDIEVHCREAAEEAETRFGMLISTLLDKGLIDDAKRASADATFRHELYRKYSID